jgi:hypothetical protein
LIGGQEYKRQKFSLLLLIQNSGCNPVLLLIPLCNRRLKFNDIIVNHLSENHMLNVNFLLGRAIGEAVSRWLPTAAARVQSRGSGQVVFVVDKVVPGQVFSEYFGFPCHSFQQILHPHNHPGQVQ